MVQHIEIPERRMDDERLTRIENKVDDFSKRMDYKFDTMAMAMQDMARIEERQASTRLIIDSQSTTIYELEKRVAVLQQQTAISLNVRADTMMHAERKWWALGIVAVAVVTPIASNIINKFLGVMQ